MKNADIPKRVAKREGLQHPHRGRPCPGSREQAPAQAHVALEPGRRPAYSPRAEAFAAQGGDPYQSKADQQRGPPGIGPMLEPQASEPEREKEQSSAVQCSGQGFHALIRGYKPWKGKADFYIRRKYFTT